MRACSSCAEIKPEEDFPIRSKDGKRRAMCKACCNARTRAWYAESDDARKKAAQNAKRSNARARARRREFVEEYKRGKPCADCGQYFPPYVMEFDHLPDRGPKRLHVSHMIQRAYSEQAIAEEIAKCDLLCCNCHRIRTARDFWGRSDE